MDLKKLLKNKNTREVVALATLAAMLTGCASYQMQQDANGNVSVQAKSIDGFGIGAAATGAGNAMSGVADIIEASKGKGSCPPPPKKFCPPPPKMPCPPPPKRPCPPPKGKRFIVPERITPEQQRWIYEQNRRKLKY